MLDRAEAWLTTEDIAALEALTPWDRPQFRTGLQALSESTAAAARQLAADVRVLSALAAQVPRCAGDDRGASPWTSFRQEIAVARSVSGQAAAAELRLALRLTSVLPHTLALLETGRLTVLRARTLVQELEPYDDELATQLDADLAEVAVRLAPWRITQEVHRAVVKLDPAGVVPTPRDAERAAAGSRLSGVEAASADCRMSRPVQAMIVVPVETALGSSAEPAWLDGYGWIGAPSARQLLVDADLRQLCADRTSGQLLDQSTRDERPPPTPTGVRQALVDMVTGQAVLSDTAWRTEPEHDPSPALRTFTHVRDRSCDGPTQPHTAARRCDSDHDHPHPHGPTAAWNLVSRSRRTHQLKHYGWTSVRTATSTIWTNPAGQIIDVPRQHRPAPGIDTAAGAAALADPDELAAVDPDQLTPLRDDDLPPVLPADQRRAPTQRQVIDGSDRDDPPF